MYSKFFLFLKILILWLSHIYCMNPRGQTVLEHDVEDSYTNFAICHPCCQRYWLQTIDGKWNLHSWKSKEILRGDFVRVYFNLNGRGTLPQIRYKTYLDLWETWQSIMKNSIVSSVSEYTKRDRQTSCYFWISISIVKI